MKNKEGKPFFLGIILFSLLLCILLCLSSCSKQDIVKEKQNIETAIDSKQISYLIKIKAALRDSMAADDFATINFDECYKNEDVNSGNYFFRIGFRNKKVSDEFVLLKTDSTGNITKAKIVHVQWNGNEKALADITIRSSSLNRRKVSYLKNAGNGRQSESVTASDMSSLMVEEGPAGEQVLPEVVVVGYTYYDPIPTYWYFYDGMLGVNSGGSGTSYIYGASGPVGGGGGTIPTMQIDYEFPENEKTIDVKKYLDCFGTVQEADATYTVTIATDIPVDGDPSRFFNWSEASPGHTYIELYKNGDAGLIKQNIGFYPNSSWKTANGYYIPSKMVDNAGHEYNARYSISVTNTQFQAALNAVQTYSTYDYNIATFNCTDFALEVFNAAGGDLYIPKYQIPGYPNGTTGSNTPQGLYVKLDQMDAAGYTGVQKPGIKGYGDGSHGPCN